MDKILPSESAQVVRGKRISVSLEKMMKGYDPLARAKELEKVVVRGTSRKYYRPVRGGKWYGGIATADCSIREIIFKVHFCNPLFNHV